MSSILLEEFSTEPLFEVQSGNGGLSIIGQTDQVNMFAVGEGDNGIGGSDSIVGGNLTDIIQAGLGNDIIVGGAGADILEGEEGNDILIGEAGADILRGGSGADMLTGGEGDDKFEFFADDFAAGEMDRITDFTQGEDGSIEDVIMLRGIGADADVSYDSATGKVSVDGNEIIQLDKNLDLNALNVEGEEDWELF